MTLTLEQLEKMQKTLQKAYTSAANNFGYWQDWSDTNESKRQCILEVSAAATALLLLDQRMDEAERGTSVSKLGAKLPGKTP